MEINKGVQRFCDVCGNEVIMGEYYGHVQIRVVGDMRTNKRPCHLCGTCCKKLFGVDKPTEKELSTYPDIQYNLESVEED